MNTFLPSARSSAAFITTIAESSFQYTQLVTSASINPPGPGNSYVGGLRPTRAIINCPVIAHPDLPPQ